MNAIRDDAWSSDWISEKISKHENVLAATPCPQNQVKLSLKTGRVVTIATMSAKRIEAEDLCSLVTSSSIEFVVNVQKEAYISKEALRYSESHRFGLGGMGDLFTAINDDDFREYQPKEVRFIQRGLSQHTEVLSVLRLDNRRYLISRFKYSTVTILALNDYDLTADAIRNGVEKYGKCDVILTSNPNCRPTGESLIAAKSMGLIVLKWGQLMGALNGEIK